ncbi:MAG: hypothetical protein J2P36_21450, partial [Ktedonobacteraceae bacterium]|nr:hypothetical protein [Ktedonobacteraceae bacterium]
MKEIAFRRGDDILRGYLHRPQQVKESAPGIVIIPGFADTAVGPHNMHRALADALQDIGCIVLR